MKQTSDLTRRMTLQQEIHGAHVRAQRLPVTETTRFTLLTEDRLNLANIVGRYFRGATITVGLGIWQGETESSATIEVLATRAELQKVFDLAGDIRTANRQTSVIVLWETVNRFDLDETSINMAAV